MDFIKLTFSGGSQLRVNINHLYDYSKNNSDNFTILTIGGDMHQVRESLEEIDVLIADLYMESK